MADCNHLTAEEFEAKHGEMLDSMSKEQQEYIAHLAREGVMTMVHAMPLSLVHELDGENGDQLTNDGAQLVHDFVMSMPFLNALQTFLSKVV